MEIENIKTYISTVRLKNLTDIIERLTCDINNLTVDDEESLNKSADLLKSVKQGINLVEETQKEFTTPLKTRIKEAESFFKTFITPLKEFDLVVRSKVKSYHDKEQLRIREEKRLLEEQLRIEKQKVEEKLRIEREEKLKLEESLKIEQESSPTENECRLDNSFNLDNSFATFDNSSSIKVSHSEDISFDFVVPEEKVKARGEFANITFRTKKVFKIVDEAKLPREYLMPDLKKIQKAIDNNIDINFIADCFCIEVSEESVPILR